MISIIIFPIMPKGITKAIGTGNSKMFKSNNYIYVQ